MKTLSHFLAILTLLFVFGCSSLGGTEANTGGVKWDEQRELVERLLMYNTIVSFAVDTVKTAELNQKLNGVLDQAQRDKIMAEVNARWEPILKSSQALTDAINTWHFLIVTNGKDLAGAAEKVRVTYCDIVGAVILFGLDVPTPAFGLCPNLPNKPPSNTKPGAVESKPLVLSQLN